MKKGKNEVVVDDVDDVDDVDISARLPDFKAAPYGMLFIKLTIFSYG